MSRRLITTRRVNGISVLPGAHQSPFPSHGRAVLGVTRCAKRSRDVTETTVQSLNEGITPPLFQIGFALRFMLRDSFRAAQRFYNLIGVPFYRFTCFDSNFESRRRQSFDSSSNMFTACCPMFIDHDRVPWLKYDIPSMRTGDDLCLLLIVHFFSQARS